MLMLLLSLSVLAVLSLSISSLEGGKLQLIRIVSEQNLNISYVTKNAEQEV